MFCKLLCKNKADIYLYTYPKCWFICWAKVYESWKIIVQHIKRIWQGKSYILNFLQIHIFAQPHNYVPQMKNHLCNARFKAISWNNKHFCSFTTVYCCKWNSQIKSYFLLLHFFCAEATFGIIFNSTIHFYPQVSRCGVYIILTQALKSNN